MRQLPNICLIRGLIFLCYFVIPPCPFVIELKIWNWHLLLFWVVPSCEAREAYRHDNRLDMFCTRGRDWLFRSRLHPETTWDTYAVRFNLAAIGCWRLTFSYVFHAPLSLFTNSSNWIHMHVSCMPGMAMTHRKIIRDNFHCKYDIEKSENFFFIVSK